MFDLHVHAGPDISDRWADDARTIDSYAREGFEGCVLKAHYESTVGRAAAMSAMSNLTVYGGLALNQNVGGFNPSAVAAALLSGARIIWMPTADAHTQRQAGLPRLCHLEPNLSEAAYAAPPIDWSSEEPLRQILSLIADFDAVLATGHLSGREIAWMLPVARQAGIRRILLTHPSYIVPALTGSETRSLTEHGALAEVTAYQLLHQPGVSAESLASFIKEVGYDRLVLSSDAGQPDSPPPPAALTGLIDRLAGQGLDRGALLAAASEVPRSLLDPSLGPANESP